MSGHVQSASRAVKWCILSHKKKTKKAFFCATLEHFFSTTMFRAYLQSVNITTTGMLTQVAPLGAVIRRGASIINGDIDGGRTGGGDDVPDAVIHADATLRPTQLGVRQFDGGG